MNYRDERQRSAAIVTLLTVAGVEDLWTLRGPSLEARRRREEPGGLATDERIMIAAAWGLWDGTGRLRFADFHRLCKRCFEAISSLLESDGGPEAVDHWIGQHTRPECRCTQKHPAGGHRETVRVASWRESGSWPGF
jgi:hypothetical protein